MVRCVLADREEIATVSRSMEVEVGTAAVLSWVELPASVTENEETEIICSAVGGYPAPVLEISGPGSLRRGSEETGSGSEQG